MNKADKVDGQHLAEAEKRYRATVNRMSKAARGPHVNEVQFTKSILVENSDGTKWADAIIVNLAKKLAPR